MSRVGDNVFVSPNFIAVDNKVCIVARVGVDQRQQGVAPASSLRTSETDVKERHYMNGKICGRVFD